MSTAIVSTRDVDVPDILRRARFIENIPNAEARLKRFIKTSECVWLGMHDGEVACVWGLAPLSVISNRAYLWLLTTDIVDQHKFLFVRNSQLVIEKALNLYPTIEGHVEVRNDRAKRWLKWLGAEFAMPSKGYIPFTIRKK